jgi:hypothetical protein
MVEWRIRHMLARRILRVSLVLACMSIAPETASARLTDSWPYEKLFDKADLVVVATAVASENCSDEFTEHPWPLEFVGVNTSVEVKHVLKGKRSLSAWTEARPPSLAFSSAA